MITYKLNRDLVIPAGTVVTPDHVEHVAILTDTDSEDFHIKMTFGFEEARAAGLIDERTIG
ncbi:hypothetical protein AB1K62_00530 [Parasphingorhabdus sp. JC815]|uniref:hypothetical protein n=1 Tax=Parasphingorhabdus sp. JC815 TaxID=3232140 RepID=UPI00345801DE